MESWPTLILGKFRIGTSHFSLGSLKIIERTPRTITLVVAALAALAALAASDWRYWEERGDHLSDKICQMLEFEPFPTIEKT